MKEISIPKNSKFPEVIYLEERDGNRKVFVVHLNPADAAEVGEIVNVARYKKTCDLEVVSTAATEIKRP